MFVIVAVVVFNIFAVVHLLKVTNSRQISIDSTSILHGIIVDYRSAIFKKHLILPRILNSTNFSSIF